MDESIPFREMSTTITQDTSPTEVMTSFVVCGFAPSADFVALATAQPAAVHMVGDYQVLYDLPLPTDAELADDGGMAAFLAECTEVE